jgi:endoglycosylceramidase
MRRLPQLGSRLLPTSILCALVAISPGCDSSGTQPPHPCTLAAPQMTDWRLHTDGTLLRDALGRIVFLRGVDAGGRSKWAPYMPFEYTDFTPALGAYLDRAASWGIDAIRVPFTWAALEPTEGTYDPDWLSRYQKLLDAAWARGIWTVVDFHQDVYSESFCGDGFPAWTVPNATHHDCPDPQWSLEYLMDPEVQHAFDAFWAQGSPVQAKYVAAWDTMIGRFADEPGVLGFEPINEPGWGTQSVDTFEATTLTDFFTRMIAHVHAAAPRSLVFVDPTGLAGLSAQTSMHRPEGDFVFAPHFYPILPRPDEALPGFQSWAKQGAQWNVPVWVGEFGLSHSLPVARDFLTAEFQALDATGLSGACWEYSVESSLWNGETNSLVAFDGTEYPDAAALVRPFARAVAGSDVSQQWDPATSTFTLSYAAGPGITEIQLPERAYPEGHVVTLDAGCWDDTSVPGRLLIQSAASAGTVTVTVTP